MPSSKFPVILRIHSESDFLTSVAFEACKTYASKFSTDAKRLDPGRAQKGVAANVQQVFLDLLKQSFPALVFPSALKNPKIVENLPVTTFAIAPGKVTCSADAAHMPTARYGYAGNREMKCAPTLSLMQHLTKMTEHLTKTGNT